ncbi:MAG: glycosyltransferase [Acidobacteria bacterium]|nr:glycosyltransferase [Acidobacteriota bacterium]
MGTAETPSVFLTALFLFSLLRALQKKATPGFLVSGFLLGLTTLCRAVSLLLPVWVHHWLPHRIFRRKGVQLDCQPQGRYTPMTPMAVAIVNYNTREHLRACLATVRSETPSEVVVVDNASSDGSVEMVQAEYPWVYLHANKTNVGYGAAANQAIAHCTAKYVLLLNSDTLLQLGALGALSCYLDSHLRAAIVGPRLVNQDGALQASCYPFPTAINWLFLNSHLGRLIRFIPVLRDHYLPTWSHDHARLVPWVSGAAIGIRREALEEVGGFDEPFFMYYEEVDLCYRLSTAGWQVHFAPVTTVVHAGGASTSQNRTDMTVQLLTSTMQFCRKHSSRLSLAELRMLLKGLTLARWIGDAVRLRLTRDACKRARIADSIAAWQRMLLGS